MNSSGKANPCSPCTKCCWHSLIKVTNEDVARWKKEQRYDILLCLETYTAGNTFLIHKKDEDCCIFLNKDGCTIHDTRPEVCRRFPTSKKHAESFDCKLKNTFDN